MRSLLIATLMAAAFAARAQTQIQMPPAPQCAAEAAEFHRVNPLVLRAIIWHESRNQAKLVLKNSNKTVDVGVGGINSVHFEELCRFGITPADLLNSCINVYVAAWHLAKQMELYGNTWTAVGAYHSRTPSLGNAYARKIFGIVQSWRDIDDGQG